MYSLRQYSLKLRELSMDSRKGNQSLVKALEVVDAIADGKRSLTGLSQYLGMPKSTMHRILHGLTEARYIREVKGIGYVLGTRLIQLGNHAQQYMPLKELARPYLQQLSKVTHDTVHLGIRDEDDVFYLDKISGQRPIEVASSIGERRAMVSTGIGKALMLDLPKTEWQRLNRLETNLDLQDTLSRMDNYSRFDYSFDLEDNAERLHCVASPIRNKHGNIIAAISVASKKTYMPRSRMDDLAHVVRDCAKQISQGLM